MAAKRICTIDGCGKVLVARGFCGPHYRRLMKYGDPFGGERAIRGDALEYLISIVSQSQETSGCIEWPFGKFASGYGAFNGHESGYAHRAVCELVHGPPSDPKLQASHSCGKGHLGCVNPAHLRWATAKSNASDKKSHGTHMRGENVNGVKLSEADVRQIRTMLGAMTQKDIADKFGVGRGAISEIARGRNWAWLD